MIFGKQKKVLDMQEKCQDNTSIKLFLRKRIIIQDKDSTVEF